MLKYHPQRILVTGGAGFIGTNFVHFWLKRHAVCKIIVLDALTYAGNRENLSDLENDSRFYFVHGDIRDQNLIEQLLFEEQIDTIVHFAAESHVDRSIHGPDAFIDTNINGTHVLLKSARKVWLSPYPPSNKHRFHHISTDEVYGSLNTNDPPFKENTPYAPNSPYAASKAAADHLVRAYHRTYGLNITISNCSNNFGPYQYPEKLIPLMLINMQKGKSLPIYGDGLNIRDWLYVEDHCRGIEMILKMGKIGQTYNIGCGCEKTNLEIVNTLCSIMDELRATPPFIPHSSLIKHIQDRPGHDRRYALDTTKLTDELGFFPQESFHSGIRKTVSWYLENKHWWKKLMDNDYQNWLSKQYGFDKK